MKAFELLLQWGIESGYNSNEKRANMKRGVSFIDVSWSMLVWRGQTNVSQRNCQANAYVDQYMSSPKLTHAKPVKVFLMDQNRGRRLSFIFFVMQLMNSNTHQEQFYQKSKLKILSCRFFIIDHKSSMN